ncbi:hypothetical protein YTPLAS18_18450 [Nitrospira sp.]|nr:hypothetical protein YTPLAS18_18450 [Nitrospira sp.]
MFHRLAHVPFNAGLLATIRTAFPREALSFGGSALYIEALKQQVGQPLASSIVWREIAPIPPGPSYSERFFRELALIRRLFEILTHSSPSRLLLTSAFPSTVLALKIARFVGPKKLQAQVVLHGISGVVGKRYRHPLRRFQDMKTALTFLGNTNIQYIVLEKPIRDTVVNRLPFLSGKLAVLEHPIPLNENTSQMPEFHVPIRFGFLGLANRAKGFPSFVKIANEINAKYGCRAEFHAIGHFQKDGPQLNSTDVLATKPVGMQMSRLDFVRGIMPLHYIVLPHEASSYALSASGVLLDAIACEKPVIARRIPIFEAMFEKHGDIGYLFDNDAELKRIVERIVEKPDKPQYRQQVLNLRCVRKSRDPETLAAAYRQFCEASDKARSQ